MGGVEALLAQWGLPLVVLGTGLEGDTVALVSGALAHRGLIAGGLVPVALAAALGAFLSDQAWFHLGRRLDANPRVRRLLGSGAGLRMRAALERHPLLPLFLFRFIWGTRLAGPLTFGATGVGALRFLVVDLLACLAWGGLFTGLGFGLGLSIERLAGRLRLEAHLSLVAAGVAAILVVAWALSRRRRG